MSTYALGGFVFVSKLAVKEHARAIRARYPNGAIISGSDASFLSDLLDRHPERREKIGVGVAHFTVATDPVWKNSRCFMIVRKDGSTTDFSFHVCLDGSKHRNDVIKALRTAVVGQVLEFKRAMLMVKPRCAITDCALDFYSCHVDHVPPRTFAVLVAAWMNCHGVSWGDIPLVENYDNQYTCVMRDPHQEASWVAFHKAHAHLRLLSREAHENLSRTKEESRRFASTALDEIPSKESQSAWKKQ